LLTNRVYLPLILSCCWKPHSIDWLQWIHTYQIFELIEIFDSMINFILVNVAFDFTVQFIPQLRDFLYSDESGVLWKSNWTANLVKRFVISLFQLPLLTVKILWTFFFLPFWLFCLWIGRISAYTFDVDVFPFLTRELFFLKAWKIDLLKLVLLVSSFRWGWESNCRSLFKCLFWSMWWRHEV